MISRRTTPRGITFLDMETPLCTASLCLQGAHLTSWKPAGQEECLFLSPNAILTPEKAIRGGIPVCWPWFGKRAAPSHGIARISEWEVRHQGMDAQGCILLSLVLHPEGEYENLPAAILRLKLGETLSMTLETTARRSPCTLTEAFHNYFLVGNVNHCRIRGLEGVPYADQPAAAPHGENPLPPGGCLDRVYDFPCHSGTVILGDPVMKRAITVKREHASSMAVWNPGMQEAAAMGDLGADQWDRFICMEPCNNGSPVIELSPGHTHTMRQKISMAGLA